MTSRKYYALFLNLAKGLLLFVAMALPAFASQDKTPPALTFFTYSPQSVDVTNGPASFNATAQATDDLSGVSGVYAFWVSPSGTYSVGNGMALSSGTKLNGTWTETVTVPQFVEPGIWNLVEVEVGDAAGNYKNYYQTDLQALGYPTTLQVTSTQDKNPPALTFFTYTPQSVDVTNGPASFNATAQATDDLSGVSGVYAFWVSPSGTYSVGNGMALSSGTKLNGTWTETVTVPQFVEPGIWNLVEVEVGDAAGNYKNYYQTDLQALGYPTTLQVTSTQDKTPPALTFFTYSPQSVDVTNGPASFNATAQATDDLSGVSGVYAFWVSPSGTYSVGNGMALSSGTKLNGTWTETVTVPQFVEPGIWNLVEVEVGDAAGNYKNYYQTDLQALGYPTTLQVIDGTSVAITSGTNPSAYNQPVTFTATVTSGSSTVATGTVNFLDGATTIGSGTLNASGVATFTTSTLSVGTHSMVADYLGDANNPPENSAVLTQTVNPAASSVAVSSSTNPSTVTLPVTLTATVSGAFGGMPTGTVTFKAGNHTLGTATLSNGVGSIQYAFPTVGASSIAAVYSGDANFSGSTSPGLIQVVKKAVTTGTVVSSLNPAIVGKQVTFTATFNSSIGPPADGETVTFKDGAVTLATAKITSGSAYFVTKKLSRGLHNIQAVYAGDTQRWAQTADIVQSMKQR